MPLVICAQCSSEFHAKQSHLNMGYGKYCSSKCQYEGARHGKIVKCFICQKETYKPKAKLRHSKSKKYFCGKSCQTKWRNTVFIGEKHRNWKDGKGVHYRRILLKKGRPELCRICRIKDKRVLAVHHIDENRKNNKIENLVWLCHNCHHEIHYSTRGKQKLTKKINK